MADAFASFQSLLAAVDRADFDRPPAIVCNAHVTALAVARSLAARDVPVIAIDRSGEGVAPASNAVALAGHVTYPLEDPAGFTADVEALAAATGHEPVVFPCMDEWVHALAAGEPSGVRLPFADRSVIDGVLNKFALYERAAALGIPYPETVRLDETDPDEAADRLGFPLVVKPALKREFEEAIGTNVIEVADREELHEVVDRARAADVAVMAQERVPVERGRDCSIVSYVPRSDDRDPVAVAGNPRRRQPLDFGTSCVVTSTEAPDLEAAALELLADAGYHGISEAEFVYDRRRERHVLLDVNTRPWKWIGLAVAAGADLPWAAYAEAVGEPHEPGPRTDVTWVSLADYLRLLATNGVAEDVLTSADWRSLLSGAFEDDPRLTTAVYAPSDPGPAHRLLRTTFGRKDYYCAC